MNGLATEPREAFFLLVKFAMTERTALKDGIAERFRSFLSEHARDRGANLLRGAAECGRYRAGGDADTLVYALTLPVLAPMLVATG
jgi:aspartate 4-decarboxylase